MNHQEFKDAISHLSSTDRERVNDLCARRINTVWQERGESVNARVELQRDYMGRSVMPVVVSETKNGLPK